MSRPRLVLVALLVGVAYYLGAVVGLALRLPGSTPSMMWPPNAILTATFLLSPPRHWPLYWMAVLPAHFLVELPVGWHALMVAFLYVTNCGEGLLAAWMIRRFSDAPDRFDSLRRVAVFLGAGMIAAPMLTSFPDAAAVALTEGEPYWQVWKARQLSNMLTELTLVPALVTIAKAVTHPHPMSPARTVEAVLFAVSFGGIGLLELTARASGQDAIGLLLRTPAVLLLPFVLWAAARFGPGTTSLTLLVISCAMMAAAMRNPHGVGALTTRHTVPSLQVLLIVLSVPLMSLAAVIEERRQAQLALLERLHFEGFLSGLSGAVVRSPSRQITEGLDDWLRRLGEHFVLARVWLYQRSADGRGFSVMSTWGETPPGETTFPAPLDRVLGGEELTLPAGGLALPLRAGGQVIGVLGCAVAGTGDVWSADRVAQLRLVAELLASALARKQTDDVLRAREETNSAILGSLTSGVAVIDAQGRLIAVNEIWSRLLTESGRPSPLVSIGDPVLELCREYGARGDRICAEFSPGLAAVLAGQQPRFTLQYTSDAPAGTRWWVLSVVPLNRKEGGAVITHAEITERKRAELEVQQARAELAHVARVSTMGELTASLAHQLNQPLTGILSNAQAGCRLVDRGLADSDEIRAILADIVQDSRRAGDIIQRTRELLRKGATVSEPVDLNALLRGVVRLVTSDALEREVSVTLALTPEVSVVRGDRVQLEQVVLNLLLNALEAVGEGAHRERRVVVRSALDGKGGLRVSVEDSGVGLPAGVDSHIFEAFYTTKARGMGMGLSIARSIVESHGGSITARNNVPHGATVEFVLPLADAGAA